jgi:serine/threonine-protein kinase RsbW
LADASAVLSFWARAIIGVAGLSRFFSADTRLWEGANARGSAGQGMSGVEPRVRLWLPACEPSGVARARRDVAAYCEGTELSADRRNDVALALTEACTNCVLHAYDPNTPRSSYLVCAHMEADQLVVTVEDWGAGVDGAKGREAGSNPGLGLGLLLIRKLASSVEVATSIGQGTRVMNFNLG